jgi:hypothetical protein
MRTLLLPSYQGPVVDFRIARLSVRVMADREIPEHRIGWPKRRPTPLSQSSDQDGRELSGVESRKPALEIGFEVVNVLQPDVKPQCRAARRPFGGRAVGRAVKGNDEALEAAP